MNCTAKARFLGKRITLSTTEGQVKETSHQERAGRRGILGILSRPVSRDDVCMQLDDGTQVKFAVIGRRFETKPGQRITAVRTEGSRNAPPLYCFNHETKRDWFNSDGFAWLSRRAPYRTLLWVLPMLALLGLWLSPADTRASMAGWTEQNLVFRGAPAPAQRAMPSTRDRFNELVHFATITLLPGAEDPARATSAAALGRITVEVLFDGWRSRNFIVLVILGGVVVPVCFVLGNMILVWPAARSLRGEVKRLAAQHQRATQAG